MNRAILCLIVIVALALAACGETTTVYVTPEPAPTPYLTDLEEQGLVTFSDFVPRLQHIYDTEKEAMDYGIETGNYAGVVKRAEHYATDFQDLQREYNDSNDGEYYGGKLDRLETLFENASNHIRRFGRGLLTVAGGSTSDAQTKRVGEQLFYADVDLEKLIEELEDLQSQSEY